MSKPDELCTQEEEDTAITAPFVLRHSTVSVPPSSTSYAFQPPSPEQLLGQWFVVHSSLPFWHDKRNIVITYSSPSPAPPNDVVNDTVTYQTLKSDKLKTVQGVNTLAQNAPQGTWDWRGSGWIKVASNRWEILGHASGGGGVGGGGGGGVGRWIVIYTHKSIFTPAAVHVYSRDKEMLPEETRKMLVATLAGWKDLRDLVENMLAVQQQ